MCVTDVHNACTYLVYVHYKQINILILSVRVHYFIIIQYIAFSNLLINNSKAFLLKHSEHNWR